MDGHAGKGLYALRPGDRDARNILESLTHGGTRQGVFQKFLPEVRSPGLWFVGNDVIGGFLSEGNVTSPAGLRQIALLTGTDPAGAVVTWLEEGP